MVLTRRACRQKARWRSYRWARPAGGRSQPATHRQIPRSAAKVGKTPPPPVSVPGEASSLPGRARALLITALVVCAALPYLNILFNGFVYDDGSQVAKNPYIRNLRYLKEIFTTAVWSFKGVVVSNYYRPMMTLGYLLCYKVFGMRAYGFHLASLLLHVLVVCLVFVLTRRLGGDIVWAFVAGAFFALHPVHTESVAWIAAVTDLELTLFYLLTFGLYLALARPGGRRSACLVGAMVVAFILALLSKEQAMTLPALATFYEHFYREDRSETSASQKLARYGALWLVGVAYILFRVRFLGALAPLEEMPGLTPLRTVLSAIALIGQYIGKLLWPVQLCTFYVFHASTSLFDPSVLAGLLVLLVLAALFLVCWRSCERNVRFASFAISWFFATLAPVLNAHWVSVNVFTERYLYLPSVGVAWLAGLGVSKLWRRAGAQRWALVLAGLVVAGLFAVRIVLRNRDWNNDIVLYDQTLDLSPDAYPILNNLGSIYWDEGAADKAESAWQRALAVNSHNFAATNNLGVVAARKKQYPQAIEFFQRAMKIKPISGEPHFNLARVYRAMGLTGPAELQFRMALAISPLDTRAINELGQLLVEEGRAREAENQFLASIRIEPNALAYDYLGMLNIRRGAMGEAEGDFRAALSLDESDSNAHFGLGYVYRAAGRKAEALSQYQTGLVKDPANAQALEAVQELRRQSASTTR